MAVDAGTVGMKRVDLVRLVVAPSGTRAVASGVRHRLPCEAPVPMRLAAALVASGVPVVVDREGAC